MKNNKKFFTIILAIGIISLVQISYARYTKNECFNVVQEIANPILEVEEGDSVKINNVNNTGFYEFSIKNFNSKNISEIDLWYTIEIISNIEEDVEFELYEGEEQVALQNLKTEQILIMGNDKIEKSYKLKIIYNIDKVNFNIIKNVQIKIHSEQEKINRKV